MSDSQPDARQQQPDDIARRAEGSRTDIVPAGQHVAPDDILAEGEKGEGTQHKAGPRPGDADDGDERQRTEEPPRQPHDKTAENEPQNIAQHAHDNSPCARERQGRRLFRRAASSGHSIDKPELHTDGRRFPSRGSDKAPPRRSAERGAHAPPIMAYNLHNISCMSKYSRIAFSILTDPPVVQKENIS